MTPNRKKTSPASVPAVPVAPPIVAGSALCPDVTALDAAEGSAWYWCGIIAAAPQRLSSVTTGGVCFPRRIETLHYRDSMGGCERIPQRGDVLRLTEAQVRRIADAVSMRVVRTVSAAPEPRGEGIVLDRGALAEPLIEVVRIPSQEEIDAYRAQGWVRRPYKPRAGDVPLAHYLYMVPTNRRDWRPFPVDADEPRPLSETGIVLGGVLAGAPKPTPLETTREAVAKTLRPPNPYFSLKPRLHLPGEPGAPSAPSGGPEQEQAQQQQQPGPG